MSSSIPVVMSRHLSLGPNVNHGVSSPSCPLVHMTCPEVPTEVWPVPTAIPPDQISSFSVNIERGNCSSLSPSNGCHFDECWTGHWVHKLPFFELFSHTPQQLRLRWRAHHGLLGTMTAAYITSKGRGRRLGGVYQQLNCGSGGRDLFLFGRAEVNLLISTLAQ